MDFNSEIARFVTRFLAIASLCMGLLDAGRLLGVTGGSTSPLTALGTLGFTLLAVVAVARLFAAVGLWLQVHWGLLLLGLTLVVEIVLYLAGSTAIAMSLTAFIFKLALMLATILLVAFAILTARRHAFE
ncbi:hypothetical protein [Pelagibacterium xiamenense]|uniref:hypothetical protein n=1 Tax=Pelagibacterium xiamenense TaxID=2901140 RepID=UPI001E4E9545|nr:hypothetical protein [Pelagibacterium xiamenense]MCD7060783.1 hypothetical protein [Pelagibacterium xiamenense]